MAISLYSFTDISALTGINVDGGSGANRIMIFVGITASGSDSTTGVSWNGESFTKSGSAQSGTARYSTIWYLIPSGVGSQAVIITSSSPGEGSGGLLVYNGVKTSTSPKNFSNKGGSSGTSDSVSITANNGDWLVGGAISNVNQIFVSTNTTLRSAQSSIIVADSNGVASPTALAYTFSSGAYRLTGIALEPAPVIISSAGPTFLLKMI